MQIFRLGKTDLLCSLGSKDDGFILLRSLVVLFIVLFSLGAILGSLSVISNRSFMLWKNSAKEIERRNAQVFQAVNRN